MARILAVDDSEQNLTMIELYLRGGEFEVVTAGSGRDALQLAEREAFDLILLDVVMPGIDGFEVCRRLKANPGTAFVPVIFLTGRMTGESERIQAFQAGAVDYLQKPVHKEELQARIRVMLALADVRSRLERENAELAKAVQDLQAARDDGARREQELRALVEAWEQATAIGTVLLDADGLVLAADAMARRVLGPLTPGQPLGGSGHAAARLDRQLADGLRDLELAVADDDEVRTLAVHCRELSDQGRRVLTLRDVTAVRATAHRLRLRSPAMLPASPVERPGGGYAISGYVGGSASVREVAAMVDRLRQGRSTVLIHGESGTGKELIARALHFDGPWRHSPFIPIHCGAISPELIESELFGYERGAFTGAQTSREGLFSVADGGTIFLDEIAETSPDLQVKLLRVLQEGEIRPVGANQTRIVDVRILAATNKDLAAMVREGGFREDLYYRLGVVTVLLPPLRERADDIPALVQHFLRRFHEKHGREGMPVPEVSRGALDRLQGYPWPGNVRELENVIDRAFALGVGPVLQEEDLPPHVLAGRPALVLPDEPLASPRPQSGGVVDLRLRRQALEREAIAQALERCKGDKLAAARLLGIARSTFYRRVKELGL